MERPILFSGPMVRAILDDRKTKTRRVMKPQPEWNFTPLVGEGEDRGKWRFPSPTGDHCDIPCPYGAPGDRLWVRETWCAGYPATPDGHGIIPWPWRSIREAERKVVYRADQHNWVPPGEPRWKPSIHMPRWASRITLEITGIRVERVQDISPEDCIAEGLATNLRNHDAVVDLRDQFRDLWDSINGDKPGRSWEDDPWVWVVEFKRPKGGE